MLGEYILPLDADDKFHPKALEKMARVLDKNPKVAFVYSWVECFGRTDKLLKYREYSFKALLKARCFISCSALFRRRIWEITGGFKPVMKWGWEDMEFWINCGEHGFYGKLIPEPLLLWRKHPGSRTSQHGIKSLPYLWRQIRILHPKLFKK